MGEFIVITQQWLIIQKDDIDDHPREATITYIVKAINNKHTEDHDIIVCLDGNEAFTSDKGGITKFCKYCKLYDSLEHRHRGIGVNRTYKRGSTQIDFVFAPLILKHR